MEINNVFGMCITEVEICLMDEVRIHFGEMIKIHNKRTNNDIIRGEYLLHIVDAAWRITDRGQLIFANEDFTEDVNIDFINYLKNKKLVHYIDKSEYDCRFILEGGAIFETFFNHSDVDEPVKWLLDKPDGTTYYHVIRT